MDRNVASAGAHALAASAPAVSASSPAASDPAANAGVPSVGAPAVSVSAPGKVNLFLALGAARPDGYHPLNTVFAQIGLSETVTVSALQALTTTAPQPGSAPAAQPDSAPAAQPDSVPAAQTGSPRIELALTRPDSNVPLDHTNLAYRAAQAVAQQAAQRGLDTPDVHILRHGWWQRGRSCHPQSLQRVLAGGPEPRRVGSPRRPARCGCALRALWRSGSGNRTRGSN